MGALTDSRKRGFFDPSFLPVSPPSLPPKFRPDLSAETPIAKKLRTLSPESRLKPSGSVDRLKKEVSVRLEPLRFPPPAPLRKQVKGPQRHIKVFGLGNQEQKPLLESANDKTSSWEMGNFFSRAVKQSPLRSIWSSGKKKDTVLEDGSGKGLTLDAYKRQVDYLEERKSGELASEPVASPRTPIATALDLTTSTDVAEEMPDAHVSDEKVQDEKELKAELMPRSENMWTKRTPLYKDLLEQTSRKYDSKLSALDFEVKLTEKKISEFRLISEKKPKEVILEPFVPLTENEENDVDLALQDPDRPSCWREILVMHEASNIEITREIIQCLRYGAWLNDEVINLYFELLKEREKREPKEFLKCHFFNTFFYKKLTSGRDGYDFKAVRRWTTQRKIGYGLIECDKIFVPIHKEIHWCLAVIDVKEKKFQYLDSLGGMDNKVLKTLARYFSDEAKEKNQENIDVNSWKNEFVDGLPLQKNGWDCGMFMLKYVDFYSRGFSLSFNQDDMNYFRRRTVKELLSLKAD